MAGVATPTNNRIGLAACRAAAWWAISIVLVHGGLSATTLQKLTLEEMAQKSTVVVRGRVASCSTAMRQRLVNTDCRVTVRETWKGVPAPEQTVAIPGGVLGPARQSFSGAPVLRPGDEYIFFLWTGRSGVTQVIGLSQGLLQVDLSTGANKPMAVRAAVLERMVDGEGRAVRDEGIDMPLAELRQLVEREARR